MATKKNLTVSAHDDSGLPAHARADAATTMRRCVGSQTFGIAAHEAPLTDFPVQPSRRDGLGTMCKPHWAEYTRALRQAQRARQGGSAESGGADGRTEAPAPAAAATGARGRKAATREEPAEVAAARALLAETDKLSGDAYLVAVASDPVQEALRIMAGTSDGPEMHDAMRARQVKYQAAITGADAMTIGEYEDAVAVDEAVAAAES